MRTERKDKDFAGVNTSQNGRKDFQTYSWRHGIHARWLTRGARNWDTTWLTLRTEKFQTSSKQWTCSSTLKDKHGNVTNKQDPAAGVGILLSQMMLSKVISYDNNKCERLCWVRLKGPSWNIYYVCMFLTTGCGSNRTKRTCCNNCDSRLIKFLREIVWLWWGILMNNCRGGSKGEQVTTLFR